MADQLRGVQAPAFQQLDRLLERVKPDERVVDGQVVAGDGLVDYGCVTSTTQRKPTL